MDVRENVKVWSLCAKFIGHVVLIGVQRVSGSPLIDLVNTFTCIQRATKFEVTHQRGFVRLAPIVRLFSPPPNFRRIYE
jgi:hypothetical protein